MKFMLKFEMRGPKANEALKDGSFPDKMQQYLKEINAENIYFTTINGNRGGYLFVNANDPSETIKFAEPLFLWFDAKIDLIPVMTLEDVQKGNRYIKDAADKYGE